MLNKGSSHGTTYSLLLVGGHTVAAALIEKRPKVAVLEALGVAASVLILFLVQEFITFVQKRNGDRGKDVQLSSRS